MKGFFRDAGCALQILLLLLAAAPTPEARAEPVKRAVLIGINDYAAPGIQDLQGAVNDVEIMQAVLVGKFGVPKENITVLRNEQATRKGILDAIRRDLIEAKPPADVAIIHFSGHGSQMPDNSNDESDGLDETIVPQDSRTPGVYDISDDEINGLLKQLSAVTPNITFIMDSCHSGTVTKALDLGGQARQAPPDKRPAPPPSNFALGRSSDAEGPGGFRNPEAGYVLLAGSRANEVSHEGLIGENRHGAFTYYLVEALQGAGSSTSYRDVMPEVAAKVALRFPTQHPDQEGTALDMAVFGDRLLLSRPFVLVEPGAGGLAKVQAGQIHGLSVGTTLRVFPAGTKALDDANLSTAQIRISRVRAFDADANVEPGGTIAPHSRATLDTIGPANFTIGVYLEGVDASAVLQSVRASLPGYDSLSIVGQPQEAGLRVREKEGKFLLEGRDGRILLDVPAKDAGAAQVIVSGLAHWARWHAILAIENPNPSVDVGVSIQRAGATRSDPGVEQVYAGDEVDVTFWNNSSVGLYVTVLDLSSDGSICVLFPGNNCKALDSAELLAPGARHVLPKIPAWIPAGSKDTVDFLKVIATTTWISPTVFQLPPAAPGGNTKGTAGGSALERYISSYSQGLTRNMGQTNVAGWSTRTRKLKVLPARTVPQPALALHFRSDAEAGDAAKKLSATREVCGQDQPAGCWEVKRLPGDGSILEVRSPATRGGEPMVSVSAAFDGAYALRLDAGAERAEPLFEMRLYGEVSSPRPDPLETRGTTQEIDDPRAEADPLWSLKYARVPEAWALLRSLRGLPAGSEAQGVVIAHPDTGYLNHEELWSPDPAASPVWPEMGYDYYQGDDDPTDGLLDDHLLDNPSHGTGSGSAIVSPLGCQLTGQTKCPTGVALAARLVPLRVHRSVVHFDTGRLTQAILDASGADRQRVKTATDVMSISMGGVPSWSLWKAVNKAEQRGYLILAAAGNYVGMVVWPARFHSVIAMAATNVGCRPWAWTSMGSSVDLSAPGESVWRGFVETGAGGAHKNIVSMGSGTTYATATAAGVAALWIARHKGSPEFERLKQEGKLTETFRALARETAWRPGENQPAGVSCDPGATWIPDRMGAGIIDAAALLARPLDGVTTRGGEQAKAVQDLPLWGSMYEESVPLAVRISDYRRLLALPDDVDLEKVAIYESEVMFHYVMSEKVAAAVEAIALRGNRSLIGFEAAREALRAQDLSSALRPILTSQAQP